ncbi:CHASE domain-containing protein [Vibrio sp. S4M6]|uniref:sensor domain-containing diguanylate cyclase n=1 Tax=Vibrio sinus TaxID=2946865 RepID=UPI00202A5E20|nr:CHASE domain-containing protein [Vibrio sinus]MCL9780750.1 CHASE domain-containing protein [Vibrio sinus]
MNNKIVIVAAIIFISGCLLSLLSFTLLKSSEKQVIFKEFERQINTYNAHMHEELETSFEALYALGVLFHKPPLPSESEFREVASSITNRHPSIQALEWIPVVEKSEREEYESTKRNSFPNFTFTSLNSKGELEVSPIRDIYYPVYYVEPYIGNEPALGYDLGSNRTRLETIEKSRDTGRPQATASVTLVQEKDHQAGFLSFIPVYNQKHQTIADRKSAIEGFVLGVFRVGAIASEAIQYNPEINIEIYDITQAEQPVKLYDSQASLKEHFSASSYSYVSGDIEVLGRLWEIVATPSVEYIQSRSKAYPYWLLLSGISLSTVMTIMILFLGRANQIISNQVEKKTRELSSLNQLLRNQSNLDVLTGLANRRSFDNSFEVMWNKSIETGQPISLILIDIDDFKKYNDLYGHLCGDECLKSVAEGLSYVPLKESDVVARFGGEEFVVLLDNCSNPVAIANRCHSAVEKLQSRNMGESTMPIDKVTVSIGVATVVAKSGVSPMSLFEKADQALYTAKGAGKNQTCFESGQKTASFKVVKSEHQLENL